MRAELVTGAVSGVWIEFLDSEGNTVGRHVTDGWRGPSVPERGQHLRWRQGDATVQEGIVVSRQFDRQYAADGAEQWWVRLIVRILPTTMRFRTAPFSRN